ncbi:MAG TPA: NYN domain-containing protein [Spirochaetota bacterium]|nr:NYN domain-containing protein [Spirochaetota bacterium]HPJ33487.1 NYN domain-containing protein [Spirochaetota bacterium]
MSLLIDGFNLIYKFPELEAFMCYGQLNKARDGLLEILRDYQKIRKGGITVVFDGKKEPSIEIRSEKIGTIDVYYSLDYSADFIIKQFIKKDLNPKMITVITSDKDIIFYINRFGAKNITSEKFADIVNHSFESSITEEEERKEELEKINPEITDEEISYWQKIFTKKSSGKR